MSSNANMEDYSALHTVNGFIKLTLSRNGVWFSKSALASLQNAPFIDMFINYEAKKLMIKPTQNPTSKSIALMSKSNHQSNVRINRTKLNSILTKLIGGNVKKHNYSILGRYLASQKATIFDLDRAVAK